MTDQKAQITPEWFDALQESMKQERSARHLHGDMITVMRFMALKAELLADPERAERLSATLEEMRRMSHDFGALERQSWWNAGEKKDAGND